MYGGWFKFTFGVINMEECTIDIRGKKIYYKHSGAGSCVVLLHGIPTHSGLWDKVMPILQKSYSVYAFDILGFGKSGRAESSELNIKAQAQMFLDIFKEMSLNKIILIGHDIGGGIAQIIAVSNPEVLSAVVLMDSVCYDSWPIELLRVESKVEMLFKHLPREVIKDLFTRYIHDGLYNKDKSSNIEDKYWGYLEGQEGVEDFLRAVHSFDSRFTMEIAPMLNTIRLPVMILWGRHDMFIRLSYAYRLSEDIRNSSLEIIDEAGHFLPEDQPEKTCETILKFLNNI